MNKKQCKSLNHRSIHTQEVQRSKYIKLDDDFMSPQKCKPVVPVQKSTDFGKISVTGYSHTAAKLKEEVPVNIKYLNLDEVNT